MFSIWEILSTFWTRHPGLLYGLAALCGSCWALMPQSLFFATIFFVSIGLPCVLSAHANRQYFTRLGLAFALCFTSYMLTKEKHQLPNLGATGVEGTAHFSLSSITTSKIPFQKTLTYKGTLHTFSTGFKEDSPTLIATNIPIQVFAPANTMSTFRPDTSYYYQARARLKKQGENSYTLTPLEKSPWTITKKYWNLAEWRFEAKNHLAQYIQKHIHDPHVSAFLTGIATGEFNDRLLSFELSRFGLQHLMAISGLHFTIIASILGFCFRFVFSMRASAIFLIISLSCYFLFLGDSPSVIRAWITIVIGLTAFLIERQHSALNALGVAILFIVLWNPFSIQQIGFQFSFAVTASILLWFPLSEYMLQRVFPKRLLTHTISMSWLDRHGYCLLFFFRQAIALGIAVNLVALPLTLYYFQKFPVLGLVYNLFFPFLISISLLLLLTAIPISLIFPWLGHHLHALNETYTHFVLNFTFQLPKTFDINIYTPSISTEFLILYMAIIFSMGIIAKTKKNAIDEN